MYARARLAILVAAALALVPAGCARDDRTAVVDAHHDLAGRIAQGHALVQQRQYDRAIDTFVQLAAEDGVEDKAIDGAGEALDAQGRDAARAATDDALRSSSASVCPRRRAVPG